MQFCWRLRLQFQLRIFNAKILQSLKKSKVNKPTYCM